MPQLKKFIAERDAVLRSMDVQKLISFYKKHHPHLPAPDPDIAEITLHKARTGCLNLTMDERLLSKKWLTERGYQSMDDGELG